MILLRPFMPYILSAGLMAFVAACGAAWWGWNRVVALNIENADLKDSIASLEEAAEQAKEARRVADAWRQRESERARQMDASIEALLTGDFADADLVLDPRITRYLDCLHTGDTDACAGGAD